MFGDLCAFPEICPHNTRINEILPQSSFTQGLIFFVRVHIAALPYSFLITKRIAFSGIPQCFLFSNSESPNLP